jgi:pimeloyl-ACP methyl ester carboxylesterase
MPTIAANGIEIDYDIHGAGPPLILLHGAGSSGREDWAAQVPLFGRAFQLYLPDARGHGRTRWDVRDGFSYEMLVADLAAFADALGLETFHVAGFSMGAHTALTFATRYPERLRTAVLAGISTQHEPRSSVARRLMDPDRRPPTGPLSEAALARRHDPTQGVGAWRDLLTAIARDVDAQPLLTPRDLRRVDLPVLVAVGDRDPFAPVDHAWGLQRQLPDGRLFVAPDCPHELMVRRPALFNEACSGFWRSTESDARRRAVGRGTVDPAWPTEASAAESESHPAESHPANPPLPVDGGPR